MRWILGLFAVLLGATTAQALTWQQNDTYSITSVGPQATVTFFGTVYGNEAPPPEGFGGEYWSWRFIASAALYDVSNTLLASSSYSASCGGGVHSISCAGGGVAGFRVPPEAVTLVVSASASAFAIINPQMILSFYPFDMTLQAPSVIATPLPSSWLLFLGPFVFLAAWLKTSQVPMTSTNRMT